MNSNIKSKMKYSEFESNVIYNVKGKKAILVHQVRPFGEKTHTDFQA